MPGETALEDHAEPDAGSQYQRRWVSFRDANGIGWLRDLDDGRLMREGACRLACVCEADGYWRASSIATCARPSGGGKARAAETKLGRCALRRRRRRKRFEQRPRKARARVPYLDRREPVGGPVVLAQPAGNPLAHDIVGPPVGTQTMSALAS